MDMIAEIRRRRLVSKESISSIARDLKLSRPTVRKHCRTQAEPVYRRRTQPAPRLGAFQETLEGWLQAERQLPKAQLRTARRKRLSGTVYTSGLKFQGMSASMSLLGHRLAIRSRVCFAQAWGSTPFILQV